MSERTSICGSAECDRPVRDNAVVCEGCLTRLEYALGDVAALNGRDLAVELGVTRARQGRSGGNDGRRSAEIPLPFDWNAADLGWALKNTLSTWARVIWDQKPADPGPRADTSPAIAAWLMSHLDVIRTHEAAAECVDEVRACVRAVERTVDRPTERWFAGACNPPDCTTELYAKPGATVVRCHNCGAEYDLAERRAWLLDAVEDVLAHAELIAQALVSLGMERVTSAQVRGYAHRNRILAHSVDLLGRPLYRIGDVIDVVRDVLARKTEQDAKREQKARCA